MKKEIKEVLEKIINKGYEAYVVGGYVRDMLLGIKSYDIDVATSMPFEELKDLYECNEIYNNYLCVKFKINKYHISVTTFREELKYEDNKPIMLNYTSSLETDSLRRDFTINSIYMDINGNLIDLNDGIEDLNKRLIKVIGKIETRLKDDKTRILRALRFMSVLNFDLDEEFKEYILNHKDYIKEISYRKKKEELDKIFKTNGYKKFLEFIKSNGLESSFEIYFDEIHECYDYLEVWKSLKYSTEYVFTKKEKKLLELFE